MIVSDGREETLDETFAVELRESGVTLDTMNSSVEGVTGTAMRLSCDLDRERDPAGAPFFPDLRLVSPSTPETPLAPCPVQFEMFSLALSAAPLGVLPLGKVGDSELETTSSPDPVPFSVSRFPPGVPN